MTFAGFFLHLDSIPPVLRWLQWLCPLKYCLEALSVNEVASGLQIVDVLEGVPVSVSAVTIMSLVRSFIRVKMNIKLINVGIFFFYLLFFLALCISGGQLLSGYPDHGWVHPWIWYWRYWRCLVYCSRTEIIKKETLSVIQ
jgi:ABC-2 type transporter